MGKLAKYYIDGTKQQVMSALSVDFQRIATLPKTLIKQKIKNGTFGEGDKSTTPTEQNQIDKRQFR